MTETPPPSTGPAQDLYRLTVDQVTGMLIIAHRKTQTFTGTLEECRAGYQKVRTHNLAFGWWGFPIALVWNAIALRRNAKALRDLEALAAT